MYLSFQKITQALRNVGVVVSDVYFNLVTLLLNTTSTNGAQNNTFQDSSSNNFPITRSGNPTQGTFTPFSQTGWSGAFNTSTTYLTAADTATLKFGSGNLTIEAFVYRTVSGAAQTIAAKGASTPTGWAFQISAADKLQFVDTSANITSTTSLAAGTWYYVAAVRAGNGTNQTTLYINAASDATGNSATNFNQTNNLLVGANRSTTNFANGYISNLRLSNVARTISSVPTTGLTTDANTIFLALNTNNFYYTDSTGAFIAMTPTGTPSVQAFEPFAPGVSYSTSNIGGSGYFDGTGDWLTTPYNAALSLDQGNFCVEAYVYKTAAIGNDWKLVNGSVTAPSMFIGDGGNTSSRGLGFGSASAGWTVTSNVSTPVNEWSHICFTRLSNVARVFLNGYMRGYVATNSTNLSLASSTMYICNDYGNSFPLQGYMSNLRIIKGSVPTEYQTSANVVSATTQIFVPPTAPVTLTSQGASSPALILNSINAGIYDASSRNNIETVGNASVSTAQAKFGTTSMFFDGTGDFLSSAPVSVVNAVNNGNCTIEMWVYSSNSSSSLKCLVDTRTALGASTGYGIYQIANNVVIFGGPLRGNAVASLTGNTWTHLAVTRDGTNNYVFLAGTLFNTFTYGNTLTSGNVTIGADVAGSNAFTGYIDEVRITNGFARYTANFTPTTTAFPTQ